MEILEAPYFDGYEAYPRDFVNWMNGMERFFEQANFADNIKVRYAKSKLIGKAQRFWENLERFRYMDYEPAITVWEDMKEKLCDEYLSPYYRAKYLPQSQCGTFQVEANAMNPHPHPISCPQCTFEQSTKELSTRKVTELTVKPMKEIQDRIAQMKQMKTQPDSIGKPRIIDHNELIDAPIKDNIDGDILVVENPPATPKPNVDIDVHTSTSVALTSMQGNESIEEQQGEKMAPKESIMLEGAHDVKVEVVECASNQPFTVLEDLHPGEVEEVKTTELPMVHKVHEEIILIPHIDFVIPNEFDVVEFKVFLFPMLPKSGADSRSTLGADS
uniref:Retrotransposon gag domain-containing protein n=1 Tax=Quercus lobata TaxID=97700 RepID=A0A7N2LP70_QUELO